MAFGIQMNLVDQRIKALLGDVSLLSLHHVLQKAGCARKQKHVGIVWILHLAMDGPPEISRINHNLGSIALHVPAKRLPNVAQYDALPIAIRHVSLLLDVLQTLQVAQIDAMKSMGPRRTPSIAVTSKKVGGETGSVRQALQCTTPQQYLPLWFDHVSKFLLNLRVHRPHVFIETIKHGDARRNRHALNVFIANSVNVLNESANGVGMADNQGLVAGPNGGNNDGIEKWHDARSTIFQRLGARRIELFPRQLGIPVTSMERMVCFSRA
jgi:hypothetical protein